MKKLLTMLALTLFTCFFAAQAASSQEAAVKAAVQKFVTAMENGDSLTIVSLTYANGAEVPKDKRAMVAEMIADNIRETQAQMRSHGGVKTIKYRNLSVQGRNASVTAVIVFRDGSQDSNALRLFRTKNGWKLRN